MPHSCPKGPQDTQHLSNEFPFLFNMNPVVKPREPSLRYDDNLEFSEQWIPPFLEINRDLRDG